MFMELVRHLTIEPPNFLIRGFHFVFVDIVIIIKFIGLIYLIETSAKLFLRG